MSSAVAHLPAVGQLADPWWFPLGSANGARFSDDRKHRYLLWRTIDPAKRPLGFGMLNPSVASEDTPDHTLTKCLGFAARHDAGGVVLVNLSPWVATDPRDLHAAWVRGEDVLALEENRRAIVQARALADPFILAWGSHRKYWMQRRVMMGTGPVYCLGRTKHGEPRHPLMLPYATAIEPYDLEMHRMAGD